MSTKFKNERVLVLADTHFPYHHPATFDFLSDLNYEYSPDRVVHLGDIVDFYAMSNYAKSPDHPDSFLVEMDKVRACVKNLASIFPKMRVCMGNHDDRFQRAANGSGIGTSMMKSFSSVIRAPKGWRFYDEGFNLRVNSTGKKILFAHHRGANVKLVAQRLGQTVITGHQHSKGLIDGFNNGKETLFGCVCPNLISNEGCPFRYAKLSNINPIQGAILINGGTPTIRLL